MSSSKVQVSFMGGTSVGVDDLLNDDAVKRELSKTKKAFYSGNPTLSFIHSINPRFIVGKTTLNETMDDLVDYSIENGLISYVPQDRRSEVYTALINMLLKKDPNFKSYFSSEIKNKLGTTELK